MLFKRKVDPDRTLTDLTQDLTSKLGDNLYSCLAYGSSVRGNFNRKTSDVNILIVLNEPSVAAHQAIADVLHRFTRIQPFVLERRGLERSMKVFAVKFKAIQRNHRLLAGQDLFKGYEVGEKMSRLMCEQALRNQRLRLIHDFIVFGHRRGPMSRRLAHAATSCFVNLCELVRLHSGGQPLPKNWAERIPLVSQTLDVPPAFLQELLALKTRPHVLANEEVRRIYGEILTLLTQSLRWLESRWELP